MSMLLVLGSLVVENENIHVDDMITIFYNLVMVAILIFIIIMTKKMDTLHKERMVLIEELNALMEQVQKDREEVLEDLATIKRLRGDLEGMYDDLRLKQHKETRSRVRPLEPPI